MGSAVFISSRAADQVKNPALQSTKDGAPCDVKKAKATRLILVGAEIQNGVESAPRITNLSDYDLDDVVDRLDNIEAAIKKNYPWPDTYTWVAVVVVWALIIGIPDMWHSRARYAIEYGVGIDQVIKQDKPHNCGWMTAPLGSKFCHYKIKVGEISRQNAATGNTEFSYDEGKTWAYGSMNYPRPLVYVGWEKIEE